MESSARQKALRGAAHVALGCYWTSLAACGGISVRDDPASPEEPDVPPMNAGAPTATAPTAPPTSTATPTATPTTTAPPPPPLACIGAVSPEGSLANGFRVADRDCCNAYIESAVLASPDAGMLSDVSVVNCCRALARFDTWNQTSAHRYCCFSAGLSPDDLANPYCSPWGPPVPPALDEPLRIT